MLEEKVAWKIVVIGTVAELDQSLDDLRFIFWEIDCPRLRFLWLN